MTRGAVKENSFFDNGDNSMEATRFEAKGAG